MMNIVKSKFLRMAGLILGSIFVLGLFSACGEIKIDTPMSENVLAEIGGEECPMDEAILRLLEERTLYESTDDTELLWRREIGNENMADYIKNSVKDEMIRNTTCVLMADSMALYLTDIEINDAYDAAEKAYNKMNDMWELEKYKITLDTAKRLYYKRAIYEMIYNYVSKDLDLEISEADTKVIEVNYVFIPYSETEDRYAVAESIRQGTLAGEDFEFLCNQAGYPPEMHKVISKGEMPQAFENVAFALVDYELSEVIEYGKNGYYVIQCVEDYMVTESVANKNQIISDKRKALFDEAYIDYAATKKLRFNSATWDSIQVEKLEER